jgi:hypothetical protein
MKIAKYIQNKSEKPYKKIKASMRTLDAVNI